MSQDELIEPLSARVVAMQIALDNPGLKFAINRSENCVGVWSEAHGRYQPCCGKTLFGSWVQMKHEMLVNGKPVTAEGDWIAFGADMTLSDATVEGMVAS